MKQKIKSIGVLCSGGDSPGMNCAIRAIVRSGIYHGLDVWGIERGYAGLLDGSFRKMDVSSVGNILQKGGTILQTSRCPEFMQPEGRKEAANILRRKNIDALIVIGGDGSFNGAHALHQEQHISVVGIPGTIDNDISSSSYTIGFDTAVQTAVEAVDKIRDTAASHARTFLVEVMGRSSNAIALHVGVCTGAEEVIFPNKEIDYDKIVSNIQRGKARGKNSSIIIVAEGQKSGLSYEAQKILKEKYQIDSHVCILGHIQRGGRPTPLDRFLASSMGNLAVKALIDGNHPTVTVYDQGEVKLAPLQECLKKRNEYGLHFMELVKTLSI